MNIINTIDMLKDNNNWSQYRLSREADLPYSTINSWYSKGAEPTLYSLDRICHAFNISMSQLFFYDESINSAE